MAFEPFDSVEFPASACSTGSAAGGDREGQISGEQAYDLTRAVLSGVRLSNAGLALSSGALLQLFESVPVAICITSGSRHRIVYANNHYRLALVQGAQDPIGLEVRELFGDVLGPHIYGARDRAFDQQRIVSVTEEPVAPGAAGRAMFWDVTYYPASNEEGATGLLMFAIDVTEKVAARQLAEERALEQAARAEDVSVHRQRLALAVEATGLGIWEWNVESGDLFWSEQQKAMWGLGPHDAATYDIWREGLHPEDRAAVLKAVEQRLDSASGGRQHLEHRIVRPNGDVRWVASRARMIYDNLTGQPLRLIGTTLDVTDRKQVEEELGEALAAKEVLLSEVNHRTKNNLQLISSMLSLQGGTSDNEDVRKIIGEAQARLQTVAAVHERLYRSEGLRSVELGEFLRTLTQDISQAMVGDADAIVVNVEAERMSVSHDRAVPVALILNELLTNAIKYAYPGRRGTIQVKLTRQPDQRAALIVEDAGSGLPDDFEKRQESSLGLRVIAGLVRQIRGEFRVVPSGTGACFEIVFEVAPD